MSDLADRNWQAVRQALQGISGRLDAMFETNRALEQRALTLEQRMTALERVFFLRMAEQAGTGPTDRDER